MGDSFVNEKNRSVHHCVDIGRGLENFEFLIAVCKERKYFI